MNPSMGLAFFLLTSPLIAADVSGEWEVTAKYFEDVSYARLTLKAENEHVSGSLNEIKLEGTIKGGDLSFSGKRPNGDKFGDFKGTVKGENLEGTGTWSGNRNVTWSAKRPATPPSTPRTHEFEPKEFHRVFSDAIPPVLHIFPRDTVRTWTVDAGGTDSKGVNRGPGGNPETGPFWIEGAFPGDTLVIKLNRVRLNRDSAQSGNRIVPTALTPNYLQRTKYEDKFDSEWVLDREKGIGRLKNPTEKLRNYNVKLQPMLGCIAVAPPGHQSFRTGYLGSYGGNLDYNQIREGTTVYLPVYAAGALLFVGDGHAAQGDGELTGDALETSMDVEFTVDLIKSTMNGSPRAENDEYLMALGIANSAPEAIQSATGELANWLQRDYKLNPNEAAMVLGTAIQYNIAELVDPLVHVVAKVRKESLAGLKP
jgi:acetamidase/formamidase